MPGYIALSEERSFFNFEIIVPIFVEMDIAAAVTGLSGALICVTTSLRSIVHRVKDIPKEVHTLLTETSELRVATTALRRIIQNSGQLPQHRANLVSLESLVATLTEVIMTISDLEALLKPLNLILTHAHPQLLSLKQRVLFTFDNPKMKTLTERLSRNKSSLTLSNGKVREFPNQGLTKLTIMWPAIQIEKQKFPNKN